LIEIFTKATLSIEDELPLQDLSEESDMLIVKEKRREEKRREEKRREEKEEKRREEKRREEKRV